ncbi:Hypothetical predicted protein [Pelobates cultripes]|uniref:Uncharacterized protein n=1 Tax=Pelobates cultripes TaxID=61616 RepID=A0AAD1VL87_PELCU|nr:Hypothetical predicted protein [Pelobates cultripes]
MGRNRRTEHSQNPRDPQTGPQKGTMDGFLHPPRGNDGGPDSPNPASQSPVSAAGADSATLERISDELRTMTAAMATKADLLTLTTTIQDALRAEMAGIRVEGAQVSLFNDLSPYTLDARRALRPVTAALRDHNIVYKWGFPFALLARRQDTWIAARWPEEVPRFLEELNLPPIPVTNWVLSQPGPAPRPQRVPRRRGGGSPPGRPLQRRRQGPGNPAE